jgi:hypothetical protein
MKYIVMFKETPEKLRVKNKFFDTILDASAYADTIDSSREPVVIPYIKMQGSSEDREFNCDSHDDMAKLVGEVRLMFLWAYDEAGTTPMASHLVAQALNHMSNAVQALHMAALHQARETK